MLKLSTLLYSIPEIGPRFLKKLEVLGIKSVKELLWHFPTRYEDFSQIYKIAELESRGEATVQGVVKDIGGRRTWRRNLYLTEAIVSDETGSIRVVWFNQPYIKNVLRPGRLANFSGKVVFSNDEFYLSNPVYELVSWGGETKHTGRIVPIYPETRGLTSRGLRYLIKSTLERVEEQREIFPEEILEKESLPEINLALKEIHFPTNIETALLAKKRFAFEDLFFLQMLNIKQKLSLAKEKATALKIEIEEIKELINSLPYELTISQKKSLWEIIQDLGKSHPKNRLLQGDVGSGKTIIVAIAAISAARLGFQTAFMAPTEILARQHYQTLSKFFGKFEGGIALLTSSEAKIFYGHGLESNLKKGGLAKEFAGGLAKIVVGTHALLQKNVLFSKLALVVVDEQHRFGVLQRDALLKNKKAVPHFLSMSATPIPRTLSLTLFGDLDLSLITELPKNRKPIITKVIPPNERSEAHKLVRNEVKKGRQVFVICPRIAAPESGGEPRPFGTGTSAEKNRNLWLEVKNVTEEYEKLSKEIFPDLKISMLHGKMSSKEKEKIMSAFAKTSTFNKSPADKSADKHDRIDILVSTSVVEVGVDIPNATIMMIEGADRFGLAQLYQFRGRVGRGVHQSHCLLFTDSSSVSTHKRLKSIVEAKNGFELAEKDLAIRGPGQFLGQSQAGMPDLAMKAIQNPGLVKTAREAAMLVLQKDPSLKQNLVLQEHLNQFQKEVHWE
ncbi:MAG: ATP-dependent DNA helicase RecG [Patescibacteria group bacterium]